MSCGKFAATPKPLKMGVIITDPKANGGKEFIYGEGTDRVQFWSFHGEVYGQLFVDEVKAIMPEHVYLLSTGLYMYTQEEKKSNSEEYRDSIAALERFTAFIRKTVKEMGEFWYTYQWTDTVPQRAEDMIILEMNVDDLKFKGDDVDSFEFKEGVFYKFVDK